MYHHWLCWLLTPLQLLLEAASFTPPGSPLNRPLISTPAHLFLSFPFTSPPEMTAHSFFSSLHPSKPWDVTLLPLPLPAQVIMAWSLPSSQLTHFDYNIFYYHYLILNFFSQAGRDCTSSFQLSTEWQFNKGWMNRIQFIHSTNIY